MPTAERTEILTVLFPCPADDAGTVAEAEGYLQSHLDRLVRQAADRSGLGVVSIGSPTVMPVESASQPVGTDWMLRAEVPVVVVVGAV